MHDADRDAGEQPVIPLFWRLFVPNACVLVAACAVLIVEPANGRVIVMVAGLGILLAVNVVLMRRAFAPLVRLTAAMEQVDPLRPGERVTLDGPGSEVTVLASTFNIMLDRVEAERRDSARRAAAGQEAERRHLAAELHDEIGQTLTALVLQLDRIARPGAVSPDIPMARQTAEAALEDVRRLARGLRPEVLDELGLAPALTTLCNRLSEQTGLLIERELPARPLDLSADEQLVVYRIAQESLTNVVRHAGAGHARISLRQDEDEAQLAVLDDGTGIEDDALRSPGGLRSMRERAVLIGAEVSWSRPPAGGTCVRLRIPTPTAAER